jgi:hypothetical protein
MISNVSCRCFVGDLDGLQESLKEQNFSLTVACNPKFFSFFDTQKNFDDKTNEKTVFCRAGLFH